MNKIFKTLAVCAVAGTLCAGVAAISGCNNSTKGEAYGLVHSAGYVGYATVTVSGDKVKDATLTEVCFPTQVKKDGGDYYASVTYGDVTMTYDAEAKTYKVGTQTLKEYFKSEANCKAYYEAVIGGKVKADGADGIMTKAALCKDDNGYWTRGKDANGNWGRVNNPSTEETYVNNQYSRWKQNRDATIKYVKEHGVDNLLKLTQPKETNAEGKEVNKPNGTDVTEGSQVTYWMDGEISTGATWTDFNSVKDGTISYAQLIVNAYNAATK